MMRHKFQAVVHERNGNFHSYYVPGSPVDMLQACLRPDPALLFSQGQSVSSGRSGNPRDLAKVVVGAKSYFIKRYNCQGNLYRFKYIFRASRARRAMKAGQLLLSLGVPTPEPLVCMEERHGRLLGDSYLVCPFLEGCHSLFDLWPGLELFRKRLYMQRLGELLGTLHRSGVIHGDSNWRNILVGEEEDTQPRFWFVDLDGVRRYRHLTFARAQRDTGHFLRELIRNGADEEFAQLFRHHWQKSLTLT